MWFRYDMPVCSILNTHKNRTQMWSPSTLYSFKPFHFCNIITVLLYFCWWLAIIYDGRWTGQTGITVKWRGDGNSYSSHMLNVGASVQQHIKIQYRYQLLTLSCHVYVSSKHIFKIFIQIFLWASLCSFVLFVIISLKMCI